MSDGRYGVLQGGGHIADSSLGHQGDNQVPQSAPAQPLTVPTHSRTVRETPLSRRLVGVADLYKGRGIESSVAAKDSAGSLEVSLMARGPPMTFNPKVVDDLSRENTRLKVELMRIGQGGRMLPIEQTLFLGQLQEDNTSLRVALEESQETIRRQSLVIADLKEHLDDRMTQQPIARQMVDRGVQTVSSLGLAECGVAAQPSEIDLDSVLNDEGGDMEARGNKRRVDRVNSLRSPTQPDLVLDTSPPDSLTASEVTDLKREIASLRADKENLEQFVNEVRVRISDLEKENASLQVKLGSSTKELEKKRDENRQWKDHIEILESERMKAQQEADACREKLQEFWKDRERERAANSQLCHEIEKGKSETQRLQRQLGYAITERNDLQQQLNVMRAQLTEKGRQEVKLQDIIQELRGQLHDLRISQHQFRGSAYQQVVPVLSRDSQQRHFEPYRFGDHRAPFPQLLSHSPPSSALSHGLPQADDIRSRGVAGARMMPQVESMKPQQRAGNEDGIRPVWRRKEEEVTDEGVNGRKNREAVEGRRDDSGNDTGDSLRFPSGFALATDQYGPLQAWLKKQNMKPAFGGTYAAHSTAAFPTEATTTTTQSTPRIQSPVPSVQTLSTVPTPQSSVPTGQSLRGRSPMIPALQSAVPSAESPMPRLQSGIPPSRQSPSPPDQRSSIPNVRPPAPQGIHSPVPSLLSLLPPDRQSYVRASVQSSVPPGLMPAWPVGQSTPAIPGVPLSLDRSFRPTVRGERPLPRYLQCPQCDRKYDSRDFTSYREHLEKCLV